MASLAYTIGQLDPGDLWGSAAMQDYAKSPGSDGASPYLRWGLSGVFPRAPRSMASSLNDCRRRPGNCGVSRNAGLREKPRFGRSLTLPAPTAPQHADTATRLPYAAGRRRVNVVPLPGLLAMSIVPE